MTSRATPFLVLSLALALLTVAGSASAQSSATLNRFSASAAPNDDFQIDRPVAPGHLKFGAMVHFDYGLEPLVFSGSAPGGPEEEAKIVAHQLNANAAFSLGLGERFLVYAGLPVVMWMGGDDNPSIGGVPLVPRDDSGLGDAYLGGRGVIYGKEKDVFSVAAQLAVTFPTAGDNQRFRGDEFLSLLPEALLAIRPGLDSRITMNLGARVREGADEGGSNLSFSSEFTYAVGYAIPVWQRYGGVEHLDLHAQVFGTTTFKSMEETPMEAAVGAKYFHRSGFIAGLTAGPGITSGFGSPIFRSVLMLGYQTPADVDTDGDGLLDPNDQCPKDPEDKDDFEDEDGCSDPDNDKDGIPDVSDRCALQPETVNGFDDKDGCPDVGDADDDGLRDDVDQCPQDPEDKDDFEDEDGCPDPDNDQDGVLDVDDKCPLEPGVVDNQGCPDPDRDGDGVVDRVDNCPDEPGPAANQGCAHKQKVRIEGTSIEILEKVYFKSGKAVIQKRSFDLLDNVAQVLNAHPEIEQVVVEGHTDSKGKYDYNMKLSQDRAESVMKYLVAQRVDASRLTAKGYGPVRPLIENAKKKSEHAENRRVEFRIPQPETGGTAPESDAPEKN